MLEKHVLKNGVTVLRVPMKSTSAATLLVLFKVGSRYETKNINGISHFVEHLMFKGTKKRPSTLHISKELDRYGAEYNAFTSKDYTGYYVKIASEHLTKAMDILFDMLLNSKFEQKEIDRERKVIFEEIKMYEENPLMHIDNLFEQVLFKGSTLGWDIAGTKQTMIKITRDNILKYIHDYYSPSRTLVVVAGDIKGEVEKNINKMLLKMKEPKAKVRMWKKYKGNNDRRFVLQFRNLEQTQVMLGFSAYKHGDKRNNALAILHTVLGGSMSSRLFVAVRERRGLAYAIRTQVVNYEDTGVFAVHAGLDAKRLPEAIKVIRNELERVVKSGITQNELSDAKNTIKGRTILQLEESSEIAGWYAKQQLFYKKLQTPEEKFKDLDKVTRADVLRAAKDIIKPSRMAVAIIGPFKDKNKIRKYIYE